MTSLQILAAVLACLILGCVPIHPEERNKPGPFVGKQVILESWGNGAPDLQLSLPPGFTTEITKGPDFDVHRMRHPDDIGVLSIYIGHHPNRDNEEGSERVRRKVGKRKVTFERSETEYGSFADALVPGFFKKEKGSGVSGLILYVFISAKDDHFYEQVWQILETLRTTAG